MNLNYDVLCCIAQHCDFSTRLALEEVYDTTFQVKPNQLKCHDVISSISKHIDEIIEHRAKYQEWYGYNLLNPWKEHCKWRLRQIRRHREGIPDRVYDDDQGVLSAGPFFTIQSGDVTYSTNMPYRYAHHPYLSSILIELLQQPLYV